MVFTEATRLHSGSASARDSLGIFSALQAMAPAGKMLLVPVIPEVVLKVDFETDTITIRPLKGLFDDAD